MRGRCVLALLIAASACHRDRLSHGCPLPPRDCDDSAARCGELVLFEPSRGAGYEDVPLDDERARATSTSYVRRDVMMLVKYATAKVACLASTWAGNGGPLALGDMSQRDGATPGTASGAPRHPASTHRAGRDIDLAYYQLETANNHLRAICPHAIGGVDQHHCTGPPLWLDARRTALLIGVLYESPRVRVIGVDGAVATAVLWHLAQLCRAGIVARDACRRVHLAAETTDAHRGWFYAHHNHLHVSWNAE
jgi:hypothetical protein